MIELDNESMSNKQHWWSKLIIPIDSQWYHIWQIFIGLLSILTCINWAYYAAFDFPFTYTSVSQLFRDGGQDLAALIIIFTIELLFGIDIILRFFREFRSDESFFPVRDISKIAKHYAKSLLIFDLIATIPWNYLMYIFVDIQKRSNKTNYYKYIYLLKVVRAKKA